MLHQLQLVAITLKILTLLLPSIFPSYNMVRWSWCDETACLGLGLNNTVMCTDLSPLSVSCSLSHHLSVLTAKKSMHVCQFAA